MTRRYDESLAAIQEMQQAGTAVYKVDDMEFGRRLAVEREIELPGPDDRIPGMWINAIWDESGSFVIYPTLLGIKGEPRANAVNSRPLFYRLSSGQHRHEQSGSVIRQGRDCSLHAPDPVSRCSREEESHYCGRLLCLSRL